MKQSCIKFKKFLFIASMAGSELVWLASGYSQGVDNGLLEKVSMVQISLAQMAAGHLYELRDHLLSATS
jgi:hypothetical protein